MLSVDIDGVAATQRAFRAARRETLDRWDQTVRRHAFRAVREIQTTYRGASATSATATRQGTGNLRASYTQQTSRVANGIEARIGLMRTAARGRALVYGAVHEEGATIRGNPWLAIPLSSIRRPSGLAPPTSEFRGDSFIYQSKRGNLLIARRLPGGGIQNLYLLRREVRIPARPPGGAINAAFASVQADMQRDLGRDVVAALGGGQ